MNGTCKINHHSCDRIYTLMKGADYFVEGSSSVAKRLYIPSMIIGMTIVAMGTKPSGMCGQYYGIGNEQ